MTPPLALAALLVVVCAVALAELVRVALIKFCRCRGPTVRYWFAGHRWMRVCKRCHRVLDAGRDVAHRYPDEAPGVRRGGRAA